jgi:Cu(I)/Ag(I) efflux system membrane fusion protein
MTVTAPAGGVVLARTAQEGDYVKTGTVLFTIADLGRVWASLQAFESDVAQLHEGQDVVFVTRAHPGREFPGRILFIDPVLDERTRTVEVRVEVANEGGLLKPGMLIDGRVEVLLDARGLPVADTDGAEAPLVIPASAPLMTGSRAVVYVRKPGEGDPVFVGRQVTLGPRVQDHYLVLEGLLPGELVVTRGNFKIDSALQIQAAPSMMNPVEEPSDSGPVLTPEQEVPICFGEGLNALLVPYYALQAALAGDDDPGSATAAGQVVAAAEALGCDTSGLGSDLAGRWNRTVATLQSSAARVATTSDLGARRENFEPLSDLLWEALASFGTATEEPVRRFHCPMAFDNAGAFWIQPGETTANPYYGDMMLRCGEQKDVLGGTVSEGS